jgi:electron transport complex protein RnfG
VFDIIKLAVVLTIISLAAALAIAVTNSKTKDKIALQQQISEQSALRQILPENAIITEKKGACPSCPQQYWVSESGAETIYALKIKSRGYAGNITYVVSINSEGSILGMNILDQSETPGLGSRVQESISTKYIWNGLLGKKDAGLKWFTEQFEGINLSKTISINKTIGEWHKLDEAQRQNLASQNSITAITGSTISTRAVTRGLETQARAYLYALQGSRND